MLIFLTGFMCSGKTTEGRNAAKRLNIPFLDLDEELEKQTGQTVASFIETKGIDEFRHTESQILLHIGQILRQLQIDTEHQVSQPQAVIATGGGCILLPQNRDFLLLPNHKVIWLDLPYSLLIQRIRLNDRPLLKGLSDGEIEQIYNERLPLYQIASTCRIQSTLNIEQIFS